MGDRQHVVDRRLRWQQTLRLLLKRHLDQPNGFQVSALKELLNLRHGRATELAVRSNSREVEKATGAKANKWDKSSGNTRQGDKVASYGDMTLDRSICIVLSSVH